MQIYIFMDTIKKIEFKWRCVLSIENHNENSILDTLYNFLHFVHLCIYKNAKLIDKLWLYFSFYIFFLSNWFNFSTYFIYIYLNV